MAALLKAIHELAESTAQEPASTGAAEALTQLAEKAADATLPGASGPTLSDSAKYFSDLVPMLRDCPDFGGSCRFGKGRVFIGDPVKSMPQPSAERAVVDCATDLEQ